MFGKKKNKIEQPVTPQELSQFNDRSTAAPLVRKYHVNTETAQVLALKKRRRILAIILGAVMAVLLILFIISMLISKWGDLVIDIDRPAQDKGIVISESADMKDKHVTLSASAANDVTNITYNWLPTDLDGEIEGEHNGDNYVAYTFYCQNNGKETFDYYATLDVTGVAKSADEATRVMIFKNGNQEIYAKSQVPYLADGTPNLDEPYENRVEPETDATAFLSNNVVCDLKTTDFKPGDIDKYTIVIWIEGNDAECVDDIRDGWVRMRMVLSVDTEDATHSPFGDYVYGDIITQPQTEPTE